MSFEPVTDTNATIGIIDRHQRAAIGTTRIPLSGCISHQFYGVDRVNSAATASTYPAPIRFYELASGRRSSAISTG
jgi:hypothetical protein